MATHPTEPPAPGVTRRPSLLKAAGLIAAVTILSKLLGAVRDWGIVTVYGASVITDAYFAAFQLPSFAIILLGGLGGPFHTATVAIFSRLVKDDAKPDERAKKLAATFLTLTGIGFTVLSFLAYLFAEPLMSVLLPGASELLIQEAAIQLKIMSPVILLGGLIGIFYGILNLYHIFFWPSLSPAAMSLAILAALFFMPSDPTGRILAWATLWGALLQLLIQLPDFLRKGFTVKPAWDWKAPELRTIGEMLFPAAVGTTIGQLMTYVDMFFTSMLPPGGWSAVTLSNRLMQLPIGVLQTALLVPIFPLFSRFAAEKDFDGIKRYFKTGVISLWFISFPMLVFIIYYTEPVIRIIFQHGSFDADDTLMVTRAVQFQALQMIAYFSRDSITRVFYAFQDTRTPLFVGLIAILFKGLFDWLLIKPFDVGGITLSTTLITFMNMFLLGWLSRRHIRDLGFREMILPFCKLAVSALLMATVITFAQAAFPVVHLPFDSSHPVLRELLLISIAMLLGVITYGGCALSLRVEEVEYIAERLQGLLRRLPFLRPKG